MNACAMTCTSLILSPESLALPSSSLCRKPLLPCLLLLLLLLLPAAAAAAAAGASPAGPAAASVSAAAFLLAFHSSMMSWHALMTCAEVHQPVLGLEVPY
jgi:hypothetical protein